MASSGQIKVVVDHRPEIEARLNAAIERALDAAGMQAESYAKLELDRDPRRIDTGLLRNSITHARGGEPAAIHSYRGDRPSRYRPEEPIPSGKYPGSAVPADPPSMPSVHVGTNVEYSIYVHEGATLPSGKKMRPNRYLKNAFERNKSKLQEILQGFLRAL